ncbi:tyrosine-type recombinase/integrase [Acidithiobacillus caldus]|jgi:integrase|uniref:tyrosine-type recombinase/integrase n=3 Tax=Acidithiobacillus caldus TaxID=33059 RepID=UPI001C06B7F5|nr:site-specific integrase [Acidithiobacillus caldus]MBU2790984.1 site-specific integrase [Acidithiobacillus caldus]
MAKPYREGHLWSFRLRVQGQDLYRTGFATAEAARREHDRLKHTLCMAGRPAHAGPFQATLGQALQTYALERFPFMKGARQDASRINRYLREAGLETVRAVPPVPSEPLPSTGTVHWSVQLDPVRRSRSIPQGLHAHRARQTARSTGTDRIRKQLARTPMAQILPYQLQELLDTMGREGYQAATLSLERSLLRRLFNYARQSWNWPEPVRNPATGLKLPSVQNARDRVLTNAEWRQICEALEDCRNPYVPPLLALLLETAMRVSEPLLHARWGDIDWARCLLKLRDAKAGARDVPLNPGAIRVLQMLRGEEIPDDAGVIFPVTYEAVKAAWQRACARAGVKNVHIHDLRHTAATRFTLELNGNLPVLKVITGHKTYSQLNRYINVKADDVSRLLHGRPLTEADAPAGLHLSAPLSPKVETAATSSPAEPSLPTNVIPLFRKGAIVKSGVLEVPNMI